MKGNFQIIVLIVFIAAAIIGLLAFSGVIKLGSDAADKGQGTVVMWGTAKAETISSLLNDFNAANATYVVNYVQKDPSTFDQDLLEALAGGAGPDMFFLPDNLAFHYANKIVPIPYSSYPVASFKSNFAGAGEVFLSSKGIIAFPMAVDPLVMYYNRSILDANGAVFPPSNWEEFVTQVPTLVKKDDSGRILQPAAAMGHFSNVTHAKDIISTLFMQAGNNIVAEEAGKYYSTLRSGDELKGATDLANVLKFYTNFADPAAAIYSWNRSFPSSLDYFSTDKLAFYFGFASELKSLINRNPNQDFLAAPMPQVKGATFKLTGARVIGLAISSFSKNFNTAFIAATAMATGDFASKFANALGVAPARRDLLSVKPNDPYSPIFYNSALFARSWLDPSPKDTDDIYQVMVEGVLSNNRTPASAINDAGAKMSLLLLR